MRITHRQHVVERGPRGCKGPKQILMRHHSTRCPSSSLIKTNLVLPAPSSRAMKMQCNRDSRMESDPPLVGLLRLTPLGLVLPTPWLRHSMDRYIRLHALASQASSPMKSSTYRVTRCRWVVVSSNHIRGVLSLKKSPCMCFIKKM